MQLLKELHPLGPRRRTKNAIAIGIAAAQVPFNGAEGGRVVVEGQQDGSWHSESLPFHAGLSMQKAGRRTLPSLRDWMLGRTNRYVVFVNLRGKGGLFSLITSGKRLRLSRFGQQNVRSGEGADSADADGGFDLLQTLANLWVAVESRFQFSVDRLPHGSKGLFKP